MSAGASRRSEERMTSALDPRLAPGGEVEEEGEGEEDGEEAGAKQLQESRPVGDLATSRSLEAWGRGKEGELETAATDGPERHALKTIPSIMRGSDAPMNRPARQVEKWCRFFCPKSRSRSSLDGGRKVSRAQAVSYTHLTLPTIYSV